MKTEERGITRRSFLATAGSVALGVGVTHVPGTALAADALPPVPWLYPPGGLDADAVRKAAYCLYYSKDGGCGHGSAQSIIDALAEAMPNLGDNCHPDSTGTARVASWGGGPFAAHSMEPSR